MTRYYCEYRPPGASSSSKRPLVIFFPGSGGNGQTVYDFTSLRNKAIDFDLSGDGARPGYILVSPQARNLHWPTEDHQDGSKYDTYHRNTGYNSSNIDIQFLDALIDTLVSEGIVESSRIYVMGWSNGGRFAALYGIARYSTPTPGGNKIAAASIYSAGNPYANIEHGTSPSCELKNYPKTNLPYYLITRTCDVITCNLAHADYFTNTNGFVITPGNVASQWVDNLINRCGNTTVTWKLISDTAEWETACATLGPSCDGKTGVRNHLRWPDGIDDGSSFDREDEMLNFLKANPGL